MGLAQSADGFTATYRNKYDDVEIRVRRKSYDSSWFFECSDKIERTRGDLNNDFVFVSNNGCRDVEMYDVKGPTWGIIFKHKHDAKFIYCAKHKLRAKDYAYNVRY